MSLFGLLNRDTKNDSAKDMTRKFNVLVLGAEGMLGKNLMEILSADVKLKTSRIVRVEGLTDKDIDLTQCGTLDEYLGKSLRFDYVVNCTGVTDPVFTENEKQDSSYAINALAVKWIAQACRNHNAKLIHVSTDLVFSEKTGTDKKEPDDDEFPVNTYGTHKLIGELFIKSILPHDQYTIVRVSWLYGNHLEESFVQRFLRCCFTKLIEAGGSGDVVVECPTDQFSFPTSCESVCYNIKNIMQKNFCGTMHANNTNIYNSEDSGMSRYEFVCAILKAFKDVAVANSMRFGDSIVPMSTINRIKIRGKKMSEMDIPIRYPQTSALRTSNEVQFLHADMERELQMFIEKNFMTLAAPFVTMKMYPRRRSRLGKKSSSGSRDQSGKRDSSAK